MRSRAKLARQRGHQLSRGTTEPEARVQGEIGQDVAKTAARDPGQCAFKCTYGDTSDTKSVAPRHSPDTNANYVCRH